MRMIKVLFLFFQSDLYDSDSIFNQSTYFCLDVMLYLSKELDERSLFEKIIYIWNEWTREDYLFKTTRNSQKSLATYLFFWILRYIKKLLSCLSVFFFIFLALEISCLIFYFSPLI